MSNDHADGDADGESADDGDDGYGDLVVETDDREFRAPPELVVDKLNRYGAMYPTENHDAVQYWWGDEWVCERCGAVNDAPVDPGPGQPDPPTECYSCEREGPFQPDVPDTEYVSPQQVLDLFTAKKVYDPPAKGFDFDDEPTFAGVYEDVRQYIRSYWAAGEDREWLYSMLACYVISTWFRERWHFVPHLLVIGRHETGKSRLLNTLSNVSYRCVHNASLTSAYLYRAINHHDCTMYISEYHRLGDEKQEDVDAVINAGQKRGETIGRCGESTNGSIDPETFDPFSHIAISTQYEPDDDTISRCFEITTQPAQRSIPRRLRDRPDLRAKLLYLRFRYLNNDRIAEAEQAAVDTMDDLGVRNRLSEKMWCILTVGELADADLSPVIDAVVGREEDRQRDTEESILVQALLDEAFERLDDLDEQPSENWSGLLLPISNVRDRFDRLADRDVSTSYIGQLRNRVNLDKVRHSDGTKIKDANLKSKLKQLAEENGVEWSPSPGIVDDTTTIEISTQDRPKHSLEEENNKPTQEERRRTLFTVCEMIDTNEEPTTVAKAARVAAGQSEADEDVFRNELKLLLDTDHRFEKVHLEDEDGESGDDQLAFNYLA